MSKPAYPASGGSYVVENGVRRRAEEATQDHAGGNRARAAEDSPVAEAAAVAPATAEPAAKPRAKPRGQ